MKWGHVIKEEISVYFRMVFGEGAMGERVILEGEVQPAVVCKRIGVPGPVPGRSGAGSGPKAMPGWFHPGSLDCIVDGDRKASGAGLRLLCQTDGFCSSLTGSGGQRPDSSNLMFPNCSIVANAPLESRSHPAPPSGQEDLAPVSEHRGL